MGNLSVSEFAKKIPAGERKVYDDLAKGLIPHFRVGKKILIPETSIEVYLGPLLGGDLSETVASDILNKFR